MVMQVVGDVPADEARVLLTWDGRNGDLVGLVPFDATDADLRTWAAEAVRNGSVQGINMDVNADFTNFVVDRFPATAVRPFNTISLRPKTPFGA